MCGTAEMRRTTHREFSDTPTRSSDRKAADQTASWTLKTRRAARRCLALAVQQFILTILCLLGLPLATLTSSAATEIRLNQIIYTPGSALSTTVTVDPADLDAKPLMLVVTSPDGKDVESVRLKPTTDETIFVTERPITVEFAGSTTQAQDGRLSVKPNEMFIAMYTGRAEHTVVDFGVMEDSKATQAPVQILPEIAMTNDERQPPPRGKRIGTVTIQGGVPAQLPVEELIFYPRDEKQLEQFLRETRGQVVKTATVVSRAENQRARKAHLVRLSTAKADVEHLPQLRAPLGEKGTLLGSSIAVLRIYSLALQYRLDGFAVAVNPRLQFMGPPSTRDGPLETGWMDAMSSDPDAATGIFADDDSTPGLPADLFGVRSAWVYLALWHKDDQSIPLPQIRVAFLDMGFAPNLDFRGIAVERNIADGTSGPGSAEDPPTVGNSLSGEKSWHGTGVVTVAGGVLNNQWGSAGTGGQVVTPMLYKMDLVSYAFEPGEAMKLATNDGAAIIN
jgi:hypothetical protein